MNKTILAASLIAIALLGAGMVAAADSGNFTVDSADAQGIHSDMNMTVESSSHIDVGQKDVKVMDTSKKIENPQPAAKHAKTAVKDTKKQAPTYTDKDIASTVAELYKTHSSNAIGMATGLTPAQVNKMIKDIKAGAYGQTLKDTVLKKDNPVKSDDKTVAKAVAALYKSHNINSITMATGLTHGQVVKMIKDLKKGVYGKTLQKSVLKKDKGTYKKQMAKSVESLYGTHKISTISMATGLTHGQVMKMIKDLKKGVYGKTLQKSILKKDKKAKDKRLASKVTSLYGINSVKDISQITGLSQKHVEKIINKVKAGAYGHSLQNQIYQKEIVIY